MFFSHIIELLLYMAAEFQVTQARERNKNRKLVSLFHSKKKWGSAEELAPIEEERTASHQLVVPAFRPRKFSRWRKTDSHLSSSLRAHMYVMCIHYVHTHIDAHTYTYRQLNSSNKPWTYMLQLLIRNVMLCSCMYVRNKEVYI